MEKNVKKLRFVIFLTIGILAFVLVFFTIHTLDRGVFRKAPEYDFIFHEVDFNTDILSDPDYLALDRSVSLKQGNQMVTIDQNYRSENGTIEFMIKYLNCMICGDYNGYKDFFSEVYFETENVPEIFTMQRIYETTVEFISETSIAESNKIYTEYRLSLDYKINRNNGTLRNDMGSDCFRTQYFLITDREGVLKIDTIKSFDIVDEIPLEINFDAIYIICVATIIVIAAVIIRRKRKRSANRSRNA